ncbi:MAG: caspase family protein [Crocosphaera sp.]|nr:caspase family protein [Crocosphaera sp.]
MTQQWEALIVGIDFYRTIFTDYHELQNLTVACKDAKDVAQQLKQYGYESFRIQSLPQQPYQKGEESNLSTLGVRSEELKDKITNLFNPPSQQETPDLALFYFSGHGWRKIVNDHEDVFLATSDIYPANNIYGISIRWLGEQIQKSPVKKIIVWLDCCFSGELINYLPENKDYCLITATRSFETGLEISYKQGLFTQTLLKGLNPDNYADGIVDSHKLKEFVEKQMAKTSQRPLIANSEGSILLTTCYTLANFKDECPYRSLSYFTETREDAEVFYGRSKITNYLINRLQTDRLIAVLGASGSGKSSLLRAGLLYQLKLGQVIIGSNLWTYLTPFSPTENPLQQLENVGWVEETKPNFMKSTHPQPLPGGEVGISEESKIIMIIDQFEECFTMCDETTREAFFKQLIDLLNNYSNLHIIIGMRSDFRGRLREHKNLVDALNKPYINLEHLNREEIEEAIAKPAEKSGVLIESSLKQQLINDVEDYPGSLPLLQYTLTRLWEESRHQGERFLTLKTYQDLGGIEGTLEKHADEVYNSLDDKQKEIAQRIFLELTQVGDTYDVRRRVYLKDLVNEHHSFNQLNAVTQILADDRNRLIVRDIKHQASSCKFVLGFLCRVNVLRLANLLKQKRGKKLVDLREIINDQPSKIQIDVVHEALIRHWKRLQQWQYQYRAAMVTERKIEAEAEEWHNKGRKSADLLQESKLGEAKEYLKDYGHLGMLDGIAEECIKESFRQNQIRRWQKRGVVGVIAAMAVVSTFFAIDSNKRATVATLKEQAATVKNLFPIKPLESLVLAIATTGENLDTWYIHKPWQPWQLWENREILPEVRSILYEAIDQVWERNTLTGHQGPVLTLAITPSGNIVSGSYDNTVNVWSPQGKLLHTLTGHQGPVLTLAITPSGNIVSGSYDKTVKVWSPQGKLLHTLKGHQGPVLTVAITPSGNIVSGSFDNVKVWSPQGEPLYPLKGHQDADTTMFWDGLLTFFKLSKDEITTIWDSFSLSFPIAETVAITPSGNIVSGSWSNTLKVWSPQGKLLHPLKGHQGPVLTVAITPSGNIVSGSVDSTLRVWSPQGKLLHTVESLHTREGRKAPVTTVAITPSGNIVSGSFDNVKVWSPQGTLLRTLQGVATVAITPSGNIVSGSFNGTVKILSEQGKLLHTLKGHKAPVSTLAITPEGNIVSGSADGTVKIWGWGDQRKPIETLEGHQYADTTEATTPEGNIVSGDGKTVKVSSPEGDLLDTFQGHKAPVNTVAITPERNIVSGSDDNTVKVWSPQGKLLYTLEGHENAVNTVAITPEGNIVSGSDDNTVKVWSPQGKLLYTFQGHKNAVKTVAITPSGNIVSRSDNSTVKVWRGFKVSSLLKEGCERLQFHPVLLSVPSEDMEDEAKSKAETAEKAAKTCLNHKGWNNEEKAEFLVRKSFAIAKETGDMNAANRKLQEAKKLDNNIDIKKEQKKSPKALIERGVRLAEDHKIDQALTTYQTAQELDPDLKIDAESWATLCWFGSLNRKAKEVLFACENAVKNSPDNTEIKALSIDSQGLARALTEDFEGAIKDFQAVLYLPGGRDKYKRKQWIEQLKKGENPFTDEVLEELKNE